MHILTFPNQYHIGYLPSSASSAGSRRSVKNSKTDVTPFRPSKKRSAGASACTVCPGSWYSRANNSSFIPPDNRYFYVCGMKKYDFCLCGDSSSGLIDGWPAIRIPYDLCCGFLTSFGPDTFAVHCVAEQVETKHPRNPPLFSNVCMRFQLAFEPIWFGVVKISTFSSDHISSNHIANRRQMARQRLTSSLFFAKRRFSILVT